MNNNNIFLLTIYLFIIFLLVLSIVLISPFALLEALNHLVNAAEGVRISGILPTKLNLPQEALQAALPAAQLEDGCQGGNNCPAKTQPTADQEDSLPTTAQCDPCALAKIKRQ
jgi:hypothetical protein